MWSHFQIHIPFYHIIDVVKRCSGCQYGQGVPACALWPGLPRPRCDVLSHKDLFYEMQILHIVLVVLAFPIVCPHAVYLYDSQIAIAGSRGLSVFLGKSEKWRCHPTAPQVRALFMYCRYPIFFPYGIDQTLAQEGLAQPRARSEGGMSAGHCLQCEAC